MTARRRRGLPRRPSGRPELHRGCGSTSIGMFPTSIGGAPRPPSGSPEVHRGPPRSIGVPRGPSGSPDLHRDVPRAAPRPASGNFSTAVGARRRTPTLPSRRPDGRRMGHPDGRRGPSTAVELAVGPPRPPSRCLDVRRRPRRRGRRGAPTGSSGRPDGGRRPARVRWGDRVRRGGFLLSSCLFLARVFVS